MASNFERMIQLADEVFSAHNDPQQLDVDEQVMERLEKLHPATLSEHIEGDGPVVWILLIPTTKELMFRFIAEEISEKELLNLTPLNAQYDALYLCSALVLPEWRKKGLATQTGLNAIAQIRKDHPIQYLFTWNFSIEGANLANAAAAYEKLQLFKRRVKSK